MLQVNGPQSGSQARLHSLQSAHAVLQQLHGHSSRKQTAEKWQLVSIVTELCQEDRFWCWPKVIDVDFWMHTRCIPWGRRGAGGGGGGGGRGGGE